MLEFHLRGRPLAVIMPNGYNGFWADAKTGQNYMTYVTEELPGLCERWFPLSPRREDRFVAGFSMGAFGALLAALNNPRRFARAGAISPVTDLSPHYGGPRNPKLTVDLPWIFGDPEEYRSGPGNLFAAAERAAASGEGTPEFLITCGREDSLYEGAEKLAGRLAELGLSSRFHPAGGIHDWTYADRALQTILDWLAGKEA
jgi:S-formylglutathione hydrolase FrmB